MRIPALLTIVMLLVAACAPTGAPSQPSESGTSAPQATAAAQPASAARPSGGLGGEVPIGAVWSLTGAAALYGAPQRQAVDLAVEEINASGFLGNARIRLLVEDDRSTTEGARAAFEKLIEHSKVVAILGPTLSNSAKAADPVAQGKKVVVLGVSNTADGIVEAGDYVFRNSLPESVVQPNTIETTKDKLGYKKVAVLYGDDDAFTKSGYEVFKKALAEQGIEVLTTETFKKGDTDFAPQLTKIKALAPEAIVVSALADEAAGIMVQARKLGIPKTVPFIGGNGFNSPQLAQHAGAAAEGAISGAAWLVSANTPGNQKFVKAYQDKYKASPDQFAAQAYAGTYILATAIKEAGAADAQAIRDALAKIKDLDTVLGRFSFDTSRNPVHAPIVQVVRGGKFEIYQ